MDLLVRCKEHRKILLGMRCEKAGSDGCRGVDLLLRRQEYRQVLLRVRLAQTCRRMVLPELRERKQGRILLGVRHQAPLSTAVKQRHERT